MNLLSFPAIAQRWSRPSALVSHNNLVLCLCIAAVITETRRRAKKAAFPLCQVGIARGPSLPHLNLPGVTQYHSPRNPSKRLSDVPETFHF
ncbi:hypothetical protein PsYK624_119650 [Phanerochaete sordida]|uniref:Uncharacterized protein n=1 Tax=Phanerochaete sordida TaxID=48140 RepID=A0A9P3GGX4_9APHY|nr:hypothetical protein PsYK624_119650 [Phanerochaete sordida]